ncbi:RICIN domain-containing protein [Actinoplanes sp. URMC 104]|uniref:RICIN domain-containing protein n=1 Tax=Actinoplanes sp. URMC 104 TaxID=3423409 RepID=UPI003F1AC738
MTSMNRTRWARPVLAAAVAVAALTATAPAAAYAAPQFEQSALAAGASQASYDQKLAVAVKFGRGADNALLERSDRDFVIEIWKHVKDDTGFLEVRAAAEQAFGTVSDPTNPDATDLACYEFIVTGVFAAYDRDIERERREAEAKRLSDQARAAAAASIDVVADAELLNASDADFIRLIWERVSDDPKWLEVKDAAAAARNGTAAEQAQFIASGMAAAAKEAVDRRIREDGDRTEAEKAAALARAAKQAAANRIGMTVTEELLSLPDRDFVIAVWNFAADGTEVQAAAVSAARSLEAADWKAFIDTGIHAARDRDIQKALEAAEAEDRRQANAVLARAEKAANRNLALAARYALAGNAQAVNDFIRVGQYEVRPDLPERLQAGHTGQCLGVPGGALETNTQLIQWPCSGAKDQGWTFFPKAGGAYELRNVNSGLCLAVGSASKASEARVIQWTCNNGTEQLWTPQADSSGLTRLVNSNSKMCLSVLDASTANGGKIVQLACSATVPSTGWQVRPRGLANFEAVSFNGDAYQDVIATEVSSGRLWLYPGTRTGTAFGARVLIGTGGWNNMDKLTTGRFNSDAYDDLIAADKRDNKLYLYPGTASGTLGDRIVIGNSGWNFMEKLAGGRFNADAYEDLIAVDSRDGKLYLYPGTATGAVGSRVVLNSGGWNGNSEHTVGRFNRDDIDDLVAVENSTGKLWFYPGTGNGTLGTRVEIGTGGWNGMSELTVGRFNADQYDDIFTTQNASGKAFVYPGTAAGSAVGSRYEVGIGG